MKQPSKVREEKALVDRTVRTLAESGVVTLPGGVDEEGKPRERVPVLLSFLAAYPKAWVSFIADAMLRRGKGFRVQTTKRRPPKGASHWRGERRPDKVEAARRNALYGGQEGRILAIDEAPQ